MESQEDKRIRVFVDLMKQVVEDTTLENFKIQMAFYLKNATNLINRFPNREQELEAVISSFTERMKEKHAILVAKL